MTKEKEVLMETLKNENLRAETRKFTGNLLNKPKTKREQITPDLNLKNKTESHNMVDVNQNNNNDEINKSEKSSVKKVKKKKKKKKENDNGSSKGVLKPGQKYKLSTNTNNDDNKKEEDKNTKIKNEDIIKNEVKPIIKDKENKKNNKDKKDILNSLSNMQYNFDNLMAIGVHGTKLLKNNNQ
jgi:hypothetical protein